MDTIRLRTLTRKSTLGFGKYHDFTVGYVLDRWHTCYLRWVYYNCDMISFVDEILDAIKIPLEYRIEKPGKFPELHEEVTQIVQKDLSKSDKFKFKQHNRKVKKAQALCKSIPDRIKYSKNNLRLRNQGH